LDLRGITEKEHVILLPTVMDLNLGDTIKAIQVSKLDFMKIELKGF
jgi:hypothetical protein